MGASTRAAPADIAITGALRLIIETHQAVFETNGLRSGIANASEANGHEVLIMVQIDEGSKIQCTITYEKSRDGAWH
jgi:hypothetical protein